MVWILLIILIFIFTIFVLWFLYGFDFIKRLFFLIFVYIFVLWAFIKIIFWLYPQLHSYI